MFEGGVNITNQHSTHSQHIAHISRTVFSTSVVVSVLIISQRSCSSSGRTVLHRPHAYLWLKEKNRFTALSSQSDCLFLTRHPAAAGPSAGFGTCTLDPSCEQ